MMGKIKSEVDKENDFNDETEDELQKGNQNEKRVSYRWLAQLEAYSLYL